MLTRLMLNRDETVGIFDLTIGFSSRLMTQTAVLRRRWGLSLQDYSWEDHGFSLVNRLYSDIGHLLDDRFRSVASLPSLHSPDLKRAIWNYIHCVIGIR